MAVLTLPQAKLHLNISSSNTDHDAELATFITAAEAVIAAWVGPLEAATTTTRRLGGGSVLYLPIAPAIDLTSVTDDEGTALVVDDLHLDTKRAKVRFNSGDCFDARYYDIVYNAGRAEVPADLLMAVKEQLRHMWDTQRGPSRRPGSTSSQTTSNTLPGAAYLLPFRVSELISKHRIKKYGVA